MTAGGVFATCPHCLRKARTVTVRTSAAKERPPRFTVYWRHVRFSCGEEINLPLPVSTPEEEKAACAASSAMPA